MHIKNKIYMPGKKLQKNIAEENMFIKGVYKTRIKHNLRV